MTNDDKAPFLDSMEAHFPQASDGDVRLCWDGCLPYPLVLVVASLATHRLQLGQSAYRPNPTAIVRLCRDAERAAAGKSTTDVERTREYLADVERYSGAAEAEQAAVDNRVAAMTDDELTRAKADVLATLGADAREVFAPRDPRQSRWLRNTIVQHLDACIAAGMGHP